MSKRFLPRDPFALRVGGVRYVFNPDYVAPDGYPGYSVLPSGLNRQQRDSFYEFEAGPVEDELDVVESATATPGAKRASKPRRVPRDKSAKKVDGA